MRILAVAHAYPRWDGDIAGAFIERLVKALGARGHAMTVVAPADEGKGGREERQKAVIRRTRYAPARWENLAYRGTMVAGSRSATGFASLISLVGSLVYGILTEARQGRIDVVHAHWWAPAGVAAWLAHRLGGPPYVVTVHGTDAAILRRGRVRRQLARRVFDTAGGVTAVSAYLAEQVTARTGCTRDIVVQPMPLAVGRFTRPSAGGGGVLTVGRLVPQKRIGVLVEALGLLRAAGTRCALTVVGDGIERAALERRAQEVGIADTTRFTGTISPDDIPHIFDDADVFVFPAEAEGLGLAVIEALLAGVPVVASRDGGGAAEIVTTMRGGAVVEAADPAQLARAIETMRSDPDARRLARAAGQELRERLAPDHVAQVYETIYARASGEGRHRDR